MPKRDANFVKNCDSLVYYLESLRWWDTILLQIATGITKCHDYYKLQQ